MSNKISFIGTGNVSWHLGQIFEQKGNIICEVYGRNAQKVKAFSKELFDCKAKTDSDFSDSKAQIFFLCVSDDAIQEVLDQLILPDNTILVHTSGSVSIDVLTKWKIFSENESIAVGVFYPVMTFTKNEKLHVNFVPFCIEADTESAEQLLVKMAQKISKTVFIVDSDERKVLHLSAVFANNFTNHLWAMTQKIMDANDLDMSLINPLILESAQKAVNAFDIAGMQTGPAKRGDAKTIKKHLDMLASEPDTQKVYRVMSESIFKEHHDE